MQSILKRLSSLAYLALPLALAFVGILLLSLAVAYLIIHLDRENQLPPFFWYLTLQFLDRPLRPLVLALAGIAVLAAGMWQLSDLVVIPLTAKRGRQDELVLGYERESRPPRIAVLSGGAGILVLANLGREAERLTCVTPVQDPVEYYYRAAGMFNFENVIYVPPTSANLQVYVELDDGTKWNIKQNLAHVDHLARRHVVNITLADDSSGNGTVPGVQVFRKALDALGEADLIILGPGSLFESILPNLLIPEIRETIQRNQGRTIYVCNLMTEPGLTTTFSVADHIRQLARFGDITPAYTLVNAQRIEPEIRRIYEAANQVPVYLNPEEYEETVVSATDRVTARDVVVEGSVVIEANLASSVVQLTASLDHPGESRTVRVLRHDPEKLATTIMGLWKRT